ncbi:MAG: Bug family tripartite tricarboxylate transporter substrate binding protein [Burkholderiales bacterium]
MRAKLSAVCRAAGCAILVAHLWPTQSQAATDAPYPNRPIRLVVPFPAGGPVELLGRAFTQRMTETLGQPFVFDNRPGASGTIGTELVVKAPRDGYTLLIANCAHSSNAAYYKKLPYDPIEDLAPITQLDVTSGNLLVVHASIPARSVKEFIALAKARPGQLNYASAGIGSPQHVTGALFASMAGIELTHVAYKGNAPALNDLLGGHVEVMFVSPSFGRPYAEKGRLRGLGIAGPRRLPTMPDVPTFHEAGLTGYDYTCYHGMWFPAGVPGEIVRRMHGEILKALATPSVKKYIAEADYFPVGNSPEEFGAFLRSDIARQASIAKKIGIQPQ